MFNEPYDTKELIKYSFLISGGSVKSSHVNIEKAKNLLGHDPLFSVEDKLDIIWGKFKL
jgi:hypothetical protein